MAMTIHKLEVMWPTLPVDWNYIAGFFFILLEWGSGSTGFRDSRATELNRTRLDTLIPELDLRRDLKLNR